MNDAEEENNLRKIIYIAEDRENRTKRIRLKKYFKSD
jgi:hypothetical protein